jgi:PAS domain S-box-containing protein
MQTASERELEMLRYRVGELETKLAGTPPSGGAAPRMDDILANLPDALLVLDRDWRIVYANHQAARISRIDAQELLAKGTEIEGRLRSAMDLGVPISFEYFHPNGPGVWLEIQASPCDAGIAVSYRDITERKHTAAVLLERDRELKDFVENAAIGIHWVGPDGTILWANNAELKLLGYTREEYVGRNIAEFHVDRETILDILQRLNRKEELHEYQARVRCKDGSIRHMAITSNVYWEDGRFVHTRCFSRDTTDSLNAEELRQRLAAIVASSDDAIISKDLDGIIQSWNWGAERVFGYTADEAVGKPISMLAVPGRPSETPVILERIARGERVEHYETQRRTKEGKVITVSLTVSPVRDASGAIIGASKVARDITEQKQTAELRERLAAIIESSEDAIIGKDLNGIISSWNRGAERIFGYTADEAIGKPVTMLAAPGFVDQVPRIIDRIKRGERVDHFETKRQKKDGSIITVSLTVSPIRNASGTIMGASKIVRDITERERNERALRVANEALVRANADLEQFAYSASHDLQEPLRMVSTYSEMLKRKFGGKLGEAGDQYIRYTVEGALRMEQLIRDILAYTHASTFGQEPTEPLDTNQSVERAIAALQTAIQETGASVTYANLPPVVMHRFQLDQLFHNLIGNAIRYHSEEPPRIHIMAERQGSDWKFSVRDNGIGIDPRYKEQIFGIFKRLHSAAEYPGTGMGLAICQRVVQRAGGCIWVDSEPGGGSTFYFTLPVGRDG